GYVFSVVAWAKLEAVSPLKPRVRAPSGWDACMATAIAPRKPRHTDSSQVRPSPALQLPSPSGVRVVDATFGDVTLTTFSVRRYVVVSRGSVSWVFTDVWGGLCRGEASIR